MDMFLCSQCDFSKPRNEFYADKRRTIPRQPCIACHKAQWKETRAAELALLPPAPIIPEGMKRCSQCEDIKPVEEFYRHAGMKDGRGQPCKACSKPYETTYRENNKEKIQAYDILYREENKERILAKQKETKKKNAPHIAKQRATYRQENREQLRLALLEWTRAHPEKVEEYAGRRRARKLEAAINDLTAEQWKLIKDMYDHRCVYCGKKFQRLAQDHIIPLSKGGDHTFTNVVPACKSCNSKKNDGPPLKPVQPLLLLPPAS